MIKILRLFNRVFSFYYGNNHDNNKMFAIGYMPLSIINRRPKDNVVMLLQINLPNKKIIFHMEKE